MTRISRVNLLRSPLALAVGATVLVAGGAGIAVGASSTHPQAVRVCVTKKGVVRAASAKGKCPKHTHKVNVGVKGATGALGPQGKAGPQGPGARLYSGTMPDTTPTKAITTVAGVNLSVACGLHGTGMNLSGLQPWDIGGFWGQHNTTPTTLAFDDSTHALMSEGGQSTFAGQFLIRNTETGDAAELMLTSVGPDQTGDGTCHYEATITPAS